MGYRKNVRISGGQKSFERSDPTSVIQRFGKMIAVEKWLEYSGWKHNIVSIRIVECIHHSRFSGPFMFLHRFSQQLARSLRLPFQNIQNIYEKRFLGDGQLE